jgi:hypothetical protein
VDPDIGEANQCVSLFIELIVSRSSTGLWPVKLARISFEVEGRRAPRAPLAGSLSARQACGLPSAFGRAFGWLWDGSLSARQACGLPGAFGRVSLCSGRALGMAGSSNGGVALWDGSVARLNGGPLNLFGRMARSCGRTATCRGLGCGSCGWRARFIGRTAWTSGRVLDFFGPIARSTIRTVASKRRAAWSVGRAARDGQSLARVNGRTARGSYRTSRLNRRTARRRMVGLPSKFEVSPWGWAVSPRGGAGRPKEPQTPREFGAILVLVRPTRERPLDERRGPLAARRFTGLPVGSLAA